MKNRATNIAERVILRGKLRVMHLQPVDKVGTISPADFKTNYYGAMKPLVMTDLSKEWPAYHKWNWQYFKGLVGNVRVALYNNVKSDANTELQKAESKVNFSHNTF